MNLEIDGVDIAYGRTQVVFDVSLAVPDGTLVCLMGRNGVGKTTLLNALAGLLGLRSGDIRLDGRSIRRAPPHERALAGIGYVPQGHQVFPHLTARENLQVVHERARRADPTAIDEALDVFPALRGLLGRPAGLLSGGQAKQLAIARALVGRPTMLVLDEPTEGIQPSIILEIEDAIASLHRDTGMSILLVEQYVEFALRLAERYAVMDGGRIVASGVTEEAEVAMFADLLAV
ncbi:MAG: urea ABC transporter ATP-binding subunit UrtE [Actinomycetota bacterium]|nr:urea ABC transporter ATP-binding subunit UrtE [Actinomycetota bacterium]